MMSQLKIQITNETQINIIEAIHNWSKDILVWIHLDNMIVHLQNKGQYQITIIEKEDWFDKSIHGWYTIEELYKLIKRA